MIQELGKRISEDERWQVRVLLEKLANTSIDLMLRHRGTIWAGCTRDEMESVLGNVVKFVVAMDSVLVGEWPLILSIEDPFILFVEGAYTFQVELIVDSQKRDTLQTGAQYASAIDQFV
jgi:hypothetical protein